MSKFKFEVGDFVRFQFDGWDIECFIVSRRSHGGGMDKQDPLYVIHYEDGFKDKGCPVDDMPGLSADGKRLPVHSMFLSLVHANIPDFEDEILMSDLI